MCCDDSEGNVTEIRGDTNLAPVNCRHGRGIRRNTVAKITVVPRVNIYKFGFRLVGVLSFEDWGNFWVMSNSWVFVVRGRIWNVDREELPQ